MRLIILQIAVSILSLCQLFGQGSIIERPTKFRQADIPFEYYNKLIIVTVRLNGWMPMKFILDTGSEHTIITKKEITDLLQITYERQIPIVGVDLQREIYAMIARHVSFSINDIPLTKDILVLNEDYFNFDQIAGTQIHGILGAEIFRGCALKIDYEKQIITLYAPDEFTPPRSKYTKYPIVIERNKPYINGWVGLQANDSIPVKLLLDTGASLSALFHTGTDPRLVMPANTLPTGVGFGLGGTIEGYIGRIPFLRIYDIVFPNLIANFQDVRNIADTVHLRQRNGIIGNDILSRFIVIIDFRTEQLWLRPQRSYLEPIRYDQSGLVIIATGANLTDFIVNEVLPNSAAAAADIRKGDQIIGINRIPADLLGLTEVTRKLQAGNGKQVRLKIKRDTETIQKIITLHDLL